MSSLFQKFLETRRKYGAFYAIVRVRDFLISTVKLLLSNIAVLDHNSSVKESDATPRSGRVIVVGNGPSLNMLPMHLLDGEDVFVSNNFHLMFPYISYRPRYLAMTDAYVLVESRIKTLEHAAAYERIYLPAIHPSNVDSFHLYNGLANSFFFNIIPIRGLQGIFYLPVNKSVVNFMIGIASRLGYRDILFIGMDLSYPSEKKYDQSKRVIVSTGDDPDHFSPEYFNNGRHFHAPEVDDMRQQVRLTINQFPDIRFRNIGIGGRLDFIERDTLRNALGVTQESEIQSLHRHLLYRLAHIRPSVDPTPMADAILARLKVLTTDCKDCKKNEVVSDSIIIEPTRSRKERIGETVAVDALGFDIWMLQT